MKRMWMILLVAVTVACGGGVDHDAMKNKVLDAHDEVMPKMGEVMNLKKKVIARASELEAEDSTNEKIAELRDLAKDLEGAYQGMMNWMRAWSENSDPYTSGQAKPDEITAFYEAEQEKIDKVKADINGSIDKAKKVLQ